MGKKKQEERKGTDLQWELEGILMWIIFPASVVFLFIKFFS